MFNDQYKEIKSLKDTEVKKSLIKINMWKGIEVGWKRRGSSGWNKVYKKCPTQFYVNSDRKDQHSTDSHFWYVSGTECKIMKYIFDTYPLFTSNLYTSNVSHPSCVTSKSVVIWFLVLTRTYRFNSVTLFRK